MPTYSIGFSIKPRERCPWLKIDFRTLRLETVRPGGSTAIGMPQAALSISERAKWGCCSGESGEAHFGVIIDPFDQAKLGFVSCSEKDI